MARFSGGQNAFGPAIGSANTLFANRFWRVMDCQSEIPTPQRKLVANGSGASVLSSNLGSCESHVDADCFGIRRFVLRVLRGPCDVSLGPAAAGDNGGHAHVRSVALWHQESRIGFGVISSLSGSATDDVFGRTFSQKLALGGRLYEKQLSKAIQFTSLSVLKLHYFVLGAKPRSFT